MNASRRASLAASFSLGCALLLFHLSSVSATVPACEQIPADCNEDELVNVLDVVQMVGFTLGSSPDHPYLSQESACAECYGVVSGEAASDFALVAECVRLPGDITSDGLLNVLDLVQFIGFVLGDAPDHPYLSQASLCGACALAAAPPVDPCAASVTIVSLGEGAYSAEGQDVKFVAEVTGLELSDGQQLQWSTDEGALLGVSPVVGVAGDMTATLSVLMTEASILEVEAAMLTPSGDLCPATALSTLRVCKEQLAQDFNTSISGTAWKLLDSASQIFEGSQGWVELTGVSNATRGELYNGTVDLRSGGLSARFDFATGGGVNTGADGLAMSVMAVEDEAALLDVIEVADIGGGLGYGVAGTYGSWTGKALHVEVDTWHNIFNGDSEFHTDPTAENHLALTRNGDPGDEIWWAAIPLLEDLNWHSVRVDITSDSYEVFFDGESQMGTSTVDSIGFSGGYVYFSASTGYATNYHRVDNIEIFHGCP